MRGILAVCPVLLLQACATFQFAPSEYPLRDGLIPPADIAGAVSFTNAQDSTAPAIVLSSAGIKYETNYHAVTEVMVQQATKELQKAAHPRYGAAKSVAIKVTFLESDYIAFFYKSKITFEAKLGDGSVL